MYMAFVKSNVSEKIEQKRQESSTFKKEWDDSREEYRLIGEMVSIRKKAKITQARLAEIANTKQQVISRIEKHENNPSLRVFCNLLDSLGYRIKIVKKGNAV